MRKAILITTGILALGGLGIFLFNNKKSTNPLSAITNGIASLGSDTPVAASPAGTVPAAATSATYTASEAAQKALATVTAWIKLFDEIPATALGQLNKQTKALPFANPRTANEGNINLLAIAFNNNLKDKTLRDYVTRAKNTLYSEQYNLLTKLYTTVDKTKVDRLVTLYPRFAFVNPDFAYFTTFAEANPFTIEERLFLNNEIVPTIAGLQ